ncbi:MAG: hypothetical protein ACYCY8_08870 [Burkholderiales bacterium]
MRYLLLAWFVLLTPVSWASSGVPSDFSTTIGHAALCLDKIEPAYFESYLQTFFGPPYKSEGDRKWYQVKELLWKKEKISDVIVGEAPPFLAVIVEDSPEGAANAILDSSGIPYTFDNGTGVSAEFGEIAPYGNVAEVFCFQN